MNDETLLTRDELLLMFHRGVADNDPDAGPYTTRCMQRIAGHLAAMMPATEGRPAEEIAADPARMRSERDHYREKAHEYLRRAEAAEREACELRDRLAMSESVGAQNRARADAREAECERLQAGVLHILEMLSVKSYAAVTAIAVEMREGTYNRGDYAATGEPVRRCVWCGQTAANRPCLNGRPSHWYSDIPASQSPWRENVVQTGAQESVLVDELEPLRERMAKARAKYPSGPWPFSLWDEFGEVGRALNKREGAARFCDELLDLAGVAMRLYAGEFDPRPQPDYADEVRALRREVKP